MILPTNTPSQNTISKDKIAALLLKLKENKIQAPVILAPSIPSVPSVPAELTYNSEQEQLIKLATSHVSCIVVGAAGTGKTTCMKGTISSLISSGIPALTGAHRHLIAGTPGIVCCAFTRRATNNLKRALPNDMKRNCITLHKLIEYTRVKYQVYDEISGTYKNTMLFEPARNQSNPLSTSIHTIIIDESSMVSTQLFSELMAALSHKVQFIFLGDIQQLPPVFGSAILGYKMLELPTVELTQVYRQALESPIIRLAHRILSGSPIPASEYEQWHFPGELKIHPWKKRLHPDQALATAAKFLTTAIEKGAYDPEEDAVLIPYNKAFGTLELNKHIGNFLARKNNLPTYEVIAGFNKHYFTVGDKVLYEKEDAIILAISSNPSYVGSTPKHPSCTLDYWGHEHDTSRASLLSLDSSIQDIDSYLEKLAAVKDDSITKEASHCITLRLLDSDTEITVSASGQINSMLFGWALTVHKAQGSEWNKVFLLLHSSHNTMLQRELLYTAATRAKKELYVICEPETFTKGITSQRITGNTLAEKAEFFKGKITRNEMQEDIY